MKTKVNFQLMDKVTLPKNFPFLIIESSSELDLKERLHWHSFLEINYFKSGSGSYIIDGNNLKFHEGDIFIINNDELHQLYEKNNLNMLVIIFEPSLLISSINYPFELEMLAPFEDIKYGFSNKLNNINPFKDEIVKIILEVEDEYKKQYVGYQIMIKSSLERLMVILLRHFISKVRDNQNIKMKLEKYRKIEPALDYIKNNYMDEITLEQLASISNMSASWFSKVFRETTGQAPMNYINRRRINSALDLLKNSNYKIADIAYECGFNNMSNFLRSFKLLTGLTPKDVRKK